MARHRVGHRACPWSEDTPGRPVVSPGASGQGVLAEGTNGKRESQMQDKSSSRTSISPARPPDSRMGNPVQLGEADQDAERT